MTESNTPRHANEPSPRRARINWAAVVGFGMLGLLWPLLRLVGLDSIVGGFGTALIAFLGTFAVWVLGAGFGDVPRPVITLTISGLLFGVLLTVSTLVMDEWPDYRLGLTVLAAVIELGRAAGFGALSGLTASAIQRSRNR
ncbi:hypothetical protein [Microbacterium sp. ProA8]|jgi:hypothetical protein|uniref:hypothetical protein n=1 Tax=Microbacterium chionoecetis TaxID=3153754 RepID=UPI0032669700